MLKPYDSRSFLSPLRGIVDGKHSLSFLYATQLSRAISAIKFSRLEIAGKFFCLDHVIRIELTI